MTPTVATHRSAPVSAHRPVPRAVRVSIALSASVLVGVLTSFGQAVPALAVVANAAGPWFVVAVVLCALAGAGTVAGALTARAVALAAALGVASLELMHLGYWAARTSAGTRTSCRSPTSGSSWGCRPACSRVPSRSVSGPTTSAGVQRGSA